MGLTLYLNLAEIYYVLSKLVGKDSARLAISVIMKSPIKIVGVDENLSVRAGELKLTYDFLSIVDVYVISLAEKENAQIYTTDSAIAKAYKNTFLME